MASIATSLLFTLSLLALLFSTNYSPCHAARLLLEEIAAQEIPQFPKPEFPKLPPLPEIPHDFPKPELPPLPEIPHEFPKPELPPLPEIPHIMPEEPKHP